MKLREILFLILIAVSPSAFAQLGGLTTATNMAAQVQTGIYILVGSVSGIVLLYYGVSAWFERKTWTDFFHAVCGVALVGGSITLATWAWSIFA